MIRRIGKWLLTPKEQPSPDPPFLDADSLQAAYDGSYYTIIGAGGDLSEWITGYQQWLTADTIGVPEQWYVTNGGAVNAYATSGRYTVTAENLFPSDTKILLFPLTGLHVGRLPIFKLTHLDRWFDDVIDNMRARY